MNDPFKVVKDTKINQVFYIDWLYVNNFVYEKWIAFLVLPRLGVLHAGDVDCEDQ